MPGDKLHTFLGGHPSFSAPPPLRGSHPVSFRGANMCYDFDMVGGPVFCHVSKSRSHRIRSSDVYPRKRSLGRRHDYLIVFILMGSGRVRLVRVDGDTGRLSARH